MYHFQIKYALRVLTNLFFGIYNLHLYFYQFLCQKVQKYTEKQFESKTRLDYQYFKRKDHQQMFLILLAVLQQFRKMKKIDQAFKNVSNFYLLIRFI